MKKLEDKSSALIVIDQEALVESALNKMAESGIRHLPVVDDELNIIGLLSDRDLACARPGDAVIEYLNTKVDFITADTELRTVALKMINEKMSALLITDDDKVTGIITHEDLLKSFVHLLERHSKDRSFIDTIEDLAYTSPIGYVTQALNQIGI